MRPLRWHLVALFAGFSALAIAMLPIGLTLLDAFWTRVLQGEALSGSQAWLLGLDPGGLVGVDALTPDARRQVLRRALAIGVGAGLVTVPIGMALYYYQVWILQRVNQELRIRILEQLQRLSLRFHAESSVGDAIYRMIQDSAMVTQLIEVAILTPVATTSRFLFGIAVVAAFDWRLALLLGGCVPLAFALAASFSRPLRKGFRRARETNAALTSRIQETLAGIRVLKAYGAETRAQERFESASRTAFEAAYAGRSRLATFTVSLFWLLGSAIAIASAVVALRTASTTALPWLEPLGLGVWTLGLYNYFKMRFGDGSGALRQLLQTWGRAQDVAIGLDRVFELIDLEPEVQDAPGAVPMPVPVREVRYEQVRFCYQADRPALESVSFVAPVGSVSAIVGPTGSGKTTLMALLLRLFDPDSGTIRIDGRDLREFEVASVRQQIATALQENLLFGTSVRENIRFAVPDASEAEVVAAARVACADGFIDALPDGYDTVLGERGTKLSTGQRQRLSIARAVLKDTPILILDEPTASLDAETERAVLEKLTTWGQGRLIFLITHRLSTIRRADQILVLRDGHIAESGSHEALLARTGGAYHSLVHHETALPQVAAIGAGR